MQRNIFSMAAALVAFASIATALRFGELPLGIGELSVVALLAFAIFRKGAIRYLRHPIMMFWVGFLVVAAFGFAFKTIPGTGAMHTGAAYLYTACFSLMALAFLAQVPVDYFRSSIRALAIVPVVLLAVPFVCFIFNIDGLAEALRINTDFPSRISAWSTNPNQLALLLVPIPFWLLAVYQGEELGSGRWWRYGMFLWALFFLGLCVRSDALLLAWIIGLPVVAGLAVLWLPRPNWRLFALALAALVLAFASVKLIIDGPWSEAAGFLPQKSDSVFGVGFDQNKGGTRMVLWTHAIESWKTSPIIGNGPGAFSWYDDQNVVLEAHNLLFDMLTQVGLVGVALFSGLYLWLLIGAYRARDPYSFMVLVALMLFSGAHFMLRQPVFSLYMIICAIAVQHRLFGGRSSTPAKSDTPNQASGFV